MIRRFTISASVAAALFLAPALHAEDPLSGAASIIGAVAPIAVAGIQAGADKAIAQTNAYASVATTQITADTQREANRLQAQVALDQAKTAAFINNVNQSGLTERQALMTMEGIAATREKYASVREQNWMDYEYNIAKLLREDKAREQQLALDKQARDLQTSIGMLRPNDGALTIIRSPIDVESITPPNNLTAATAATASQSDDGTVQGRLTKSVASNSMAQKLSGFRATTSATRAATLPQFNLTATTVALNTPIVRGSNAGKQLAIATVDASAVTNRAFKSKRAASAGLPGIPHGVNGRASNKTALYANGGGSDGGSTEGNHHH